MRRMRFAALVPGVLLLAACGGGGAMGTLGDILGGMGGMGGTGGSQQGQITGEVQQVDTRNQRIYLRTQSGQTGTVFYDRQTQVIYRQQQYPPTALEPGDVITVQVQQDAQNNLYAQQIHVEQSVQERTGQTGQTGSGAIQQMEGQVGQIDYDRGWFELLSRYGGSVTVTLPYNPGRAVTDRFQRLRRGDSVRLEGRTLTDRRVELYRFL